PLVAQELRGARHPANGAAVLNRPEVGVPAWRGDAGTVAAAVGQARVGPRDPGRFHFDPFEVAENRFITLGVISRDVRRGMPGTTDDSDASKPLLFGSANGLAHVCLPLRLLLVARRQILA